MQDINATTRSCSHPVEDHVQLELKNREPEGLDVEAVVDKYDVESRTRTFKSILMLRIITIFAVFVALYHLYTAYFGTPPTLIHRSIHVSAILILIFLIYPPLKDLSSKWWYVPDVGLAALSMMPTAYLMLNYENIALQAGRFDSLDAIVAATMIVLIIEATRRVTGWALPILAIAFIIFALVGRSLPGLLRHRGYSWDSVSYNLFASTEGIFGTAVGVSSTYIILFILFGAILSKAGVSQLFNDLALAIAGQTRGGPAKVAVIASGFMGSINGSAVANVVSTGVFTIPMMRRLGYSRKFSAAVEATASTGGQILPPIMGASAFIMAETLGMPYSHIALAALLPALLYYISLIIQIHLRATKLGLKGVSKDSIPLVKNVVIERGHMLLPLGFLLYMLFFSGRTILYSAFLTIIVTVIVAMLRKTTRLNFGQLVEGMEDGIKQTLGVAIACACVGIVVGVVSVTGFGTTLASSIIGLAGGVLLFALFFTMIACLILGMGLPTIPAYIITASMAAPALSGLGVEPLVAHLFVFYFGLLSNVTPPVALAAFAASGLSGSKAMETGFSAARLAAAGFIIPFVFVASPELLLINTSIATGIVVVVTALVGIAMFGIAVEGHFMESVSWWNRLLIAVGAIFLLIGTGVVLNLIGGVMCLGGCAIQVLKAKANNNLSFSAI